MVHISKLSATPTERPYNNQLTDKNLDNPPHIAAHLQAAQNPTHRPELAKELQSCQRTQVHPPPRKHKDNFTNSVSNFIEFFLLVSKNKLKFGHNLSRK